MSAADAILSQPDLATLLTPVVIAQIYNCHPSAVVRWIQKGTPISTGVRLWLAAVRTPGGWRIRREDLEQFLEALTADRGGKGTLPSASARSARAATILESSGW